METLLSLSEENNASCNTSPLKHLEKDISTSEESSEIGLLKDSSQIYSVDSDNLPLSYPFINSDKSCQHKKRLALPFLYHY